MNEYKELNTGVYFVRFLLLIIPVVNIIAAIYWAMSGVNDEEKAFGKAALLIILAVTAAAVVGSVAAWNYILSIIKIPM